MVLRPVGFGVSGLHRVSSSLSGPADPPFRALSGRFTFTVRRHNFNTNSLPSGQRVGWLVFRVGFLERGIVLCPAPHG